MKQYVIALVISFGWMIFQQTEPENCIFYHITHQFARPTV